MADSQQMLYEQAASMQHPSYVLTVEVLSFDFSSHILLSDIGKIQTCSEKERGKLHIQKAEQLKQPQTIHLRTVIKLNLSDILPIPMGEITAHCHFDRADP